MREDRLNNFRLWCKGWYVPINDMDIIAQAQKALVLDDYLPCNNPIAIALIYIDKLVEKGIISPISLLVWNKDIVYSMNMYGMDYNKAMMYRIKNFFAFECDELTLKPPTYSREVYKLGFKAPKHFGNSYKLATYKASKLWKVK